MDIKTIEREALGLPPQARVRLAHELLESLDTLSPGELERLWLDEAEYRLRELDAGRTSLVDAADAMRKAQALVNEAGIP